MSNQRSRKVRMGSSRHRRDKPVILVPDETLKTQMDSDNMTTEHTDSVKSDPSEHETQLGSKRRNTRQHDFTEPISEALHETSVDIANKSENVTGVILPPSTVEMEVSANASQTPPEPHEEDMHGNNKAEKLGISGSHEFTGEQWRELSDYRVVTQMGMSDESGQETKPQVSSPVNDNRIQVSQGSGEESHFLEDVQSSIEKEHEVKEEVNPLVTQSETPIQSMELLDPLLIEVHNQEKPQQEAELMTDTPCTPHESHGTTGICVESQPLLTIQNTFNPSNNQAVQDGLETIKSDHILTTALQSEYSSASANDENDHTLLTGRSEDISFNGGALGNLIKPPNKKDEGLMEPEINDCEDVCREKTSYLESTTVSKDGCDIDSSKTASIEFNPSSEQAIPTSSHFSPSESDSVDLSTDVTDLNPLATVAQHCPSSGEDPCEFKLTEMASNVSNINQEHCDLDKSSRKKRKMGSTRKTNNRRGRGGEDHTGETTEPDLSPDLNMTNTSFEDELKVEMKCNLELQEEGRPASLTNKGADCLGLTPPQSVEIKERDSEDITDKEPKEIIHPPPEGSHANEDHRKEEESEEHSEDNVDTGGQHPPADLSNVDQISAPENQWSLPNIKDHDKHISRRRKMGSSRWSASLGSKKVLEDPKENNLKDNKEGAGKIVTDDNEPSSLGGDAHRSMTENLSATQNIERRKPGSTYVPFRMTPIQENIQEKQDVDSEVLEDGKIFRDELKIKDKDTEQNEERSPETQQYSSVVTLIRNSESEENQATCGETGGADMSLSGRPSELSKNEHFEGRRRKMGSHRKSRDYHSKDQRDAPTELLSQPITGKAALTFDTSKKFDVRANGFNVVMVGSSSVGKTSFMKRLQSGLFSSDFSASIGIDMCMHAVPVDGREVMLQLWDTAGQERFHSISRQILHKGQAFLLMYDITSFKSFSDVRYWISCIQQSAGEHVIMLLLGNKSDCAARQVNASEGQLLAKEYNIDFNECSAATGEHIVSSVESLARALTEKYHQLEQGIVVQKQQKKTSTCC